MGLLRYYTGVFVRSTFPPSLVSRLNRSRKKLNSRWRGLSRTVAIARYGHFGRDEFRQGLIEAGVERGGVLLVQSSFDRLYNFDGTAEDVVDILEDVVGPEGTLLMPAHPIYRGSGPFVFDVRRTPPQTGLLCEIFRRRPGTRRSLHPTHSVCARGPLAEVLLGEHHLDPLSCGPRSPYFKLAEHGGQILGIGLPTGYTTFFHVVEDVDLEGYPRRMYLRDSDRYTIIDEEGHKSEMTISERDPIVLATLNLKRIVRHLSKESLRPFSLRGVPAFLAKASPFLQELFVLRDNGILLYS